MSMDQPDAVGTLVEQRAVDLDASVDLIRPDWGPVLFVLQISLVRLVGEF